MSHYGIKYDIHKNEKILYDKSTAVLFAMDKESAINMLADSLLWKMEYNALHIQELKKINI
jgi:hypothetical protein